MRNTVSYERPETLAEARSLLAERPGSRIVAGGQTLVPSLRRESSEVDCLVDITHVDGRGYVEKDGDEIRIGCLATYADVAESPVVREHCPFLSDAVAEIGDRQVRNRGTFCGGVAAANRLGDPPVLALAADARVVTYGGDALEATRFFEADRASTDEVIEEVRVPVGGPRRRRAHERYTPNDGAYPVALVGVAATVADDRFEDPRVAVSGVRPPHRLSEVESWLDGRPRGEDTTEALANRVASSVEPVADFEGSAEFKTKILESLARRAVESVASEPETEAESAEDRYE